MDKLFTKEFDDFKSYLISIGFKYDIMYDCIPNVSRDTFVYKKTDITHKILIVYYSFHTAEIIYFTSPIEYETRTDDIVRKIFYSDDNDELLKTIKFIKSYFPIENRLLKIKNLIN